MPPGGLRSTRAQRVDPRASGGTVSDSRLREVERRWRETKADEDEAAFLRERVRVGDLSQTRLEQASLLGYPGAALALGQPFDHDHRIRALRNPSNVLPPELWIRVAIAVIAVPAHLIQKYWGPLPPVALQILASIEEWLGQGLPDNLAIRIGEQEEELSAALPPVSDLAGQAPQSKLAQDVAILASYVRGGSRWSRVGERRDHARLGVMFGFITDSMILVGPRWAAPDSLLADLESGGRKFRPEFEARILGALDRNVIPWLLQPLLT